MIKYNKFKPLLNRILVEKIELTSKSKGGILLDTGKAQQIGKIKAVGPGVHKDGTFIKT